MNNQTSQDIKDTDI